MVVRRSSATSSTGSSGRRLDRLAKWWNGFCAVIPLLEPPRPSNAFLAEADVAKAEDAYESRELGLGYRFVEQVRSTLTRIGRNPFQYQVITGTREHRRAPVQQFQFGIWYRVEPDECVVVACLAHRQDLSVARRRAMRSVEPT